MAEIWRDVDGYDGKYQVSNFGRVKSFQRGERILKPGLDYKGYPYVALWHGGKGKHTFVHRLVAEAFIPNPDNKPQVNHVDGDKANNHTDNLEWCTQSENTRHAYVTGLISLPQGESNYQAKLTNEQAVYIRENPDGLTGRELARRFNTTPVTISDIQRGKKYRNAGGTIREPRCQKRAVHLPDEIRDEIRRLYVYGSREFGSVALARKYGVDHSTILKIINEK